MSERGKVIFEALANAGAQVGQQESRNGLLAEALPGLNGGVTESLAEIARQLEPLRNAGQAQAEAVGENTEAVSQNTQAQGSRGSGAAAADALKTASRFLGGGLTFMPLLSGLTKLFGGGQTETPPPLVTYIAPQARNFSGAVAAGSYEPLTASDYSQDGLPRPASGASPTSAPQVTINVQAMDSRSFLDHSTEIARAVRQAMLNAHSLNDVFNEL